MSGSDAVAQPQPTAAVSRPASAGPVQLARSALFAGWMFASAIVLGFLCLPLLAGPPRGAMTPIRLWAKAQLWALRVLVGTRVEIRGREHLPRGAYVLASKHQGMLDTLVAMTLTPWPCIVLKRELAGIPIFGWYARKAQMIILDRAGRPGDVRAMVEAGRRALAKGRQVLIYPEGTRRPPGADPIYKGGAGLLCKELDARCAPIATNSGLVWPAHGLLKRRGLAIYEILPAVEAGLPRKTLTARLEAAIEPASRRLAAEGAGLSR